MGGGRPRITRHRQDDRQTTYLSHGREGPGVSIPLRHNPHLLTTCRYLSSTDNSNELVFRHFFTVGQLATRELLQRYRTEAHAAIRKRLGANLCYIDTLRDTVTVVTKKADQHQGEWITTGDIRVRFPSARAVGTTYEQQRNQQRNTDTHADRLLGHTGQVSLTLIPARYIGEIAHDDTLHKACTNFRGKDNINLLQLFRDNLHELYDKLKKGKKGKNIPYKRYS